LAFVGRSRARRRDLRGPPFAEHYIPGDRLGRARPRRAAAPTVNAARAAGGRRPGGRFGAHNAHLFLDRPVNGRCCAAQADPSSVISEAGGRRGSPRPLDGHSAGQGRRPKA